MVTAKRRDWTEERKEVLKDITWEEIEAIADRLEAEPTERRGLTPEELDEKYGRIEEPQTTKRRPELVSA
jgi:phytoene dehydrogenase-like protein